MDKALLIAVNIPEIIPRYFVSAGAYYVDYIALWYIECFIGYAPSIMAFIRRLALFGMFSQ